MGGSEAVNDGVYLLNVGQSAWEFAELTLRSIDVKELASIRAVFNFGDFALPTGELDVFTDREVRHLWL